MPTIRERTALLVDETRATELTEASLHWPSLTLTAAQLADLELLLSGGCPSRHGPGVTEDGYDGPVRMPRHTVDIGDAHALTSESTEKPRPGVTVALRDSEGVMIAALRVTEMAGSALSGVVEGLQLPDHPDYPELRFTPASLQAELLGRGWCTPTDPAPTALWVDGLLHTADLDRIEALTADGNTVVVLAPVGGADPADARHHLRVRCLRAGLATLIDVRAMLALVPVRAMPRLTEAVALGPDTTIRVGTTTGDPVSDNQVSDNQITNHQPAGHRETDDRETEPALAAEVIHRAQVAVAYGLGSVIVGPAPSAPGASALGLLLERGTRLPPVLTPPAVAAELVRAQPPRAERGLTVMFTGLSGSGKSTVAGLLVCRLLERGDRRVTLLDGDVVRLHLSKGLGFSREDRNTNVARIGFVAAAVTAAGGTAVCAPIAPYDAVRRQVRTMVEDSGGGFVLVHVATPLEICEARDRKGLYAKARAGIIPTFTGVSDPYEEPADAEIVIDTTQTSSQDAVQTILDHLCTHGWLAP
ncbi:MULTISPECIES: adenylyl-sulfate kinase [unclassified Frankia]|uniref:adenylyl-sulfate kinase n=1 Tax=unclassified Frankia TaxID=2632575 RepID=UPI002AD1FEF1|nr:MULTISPECIES: adenylyl-sulfate kinase [unclassified Frankia]